MHERKVEDFGSYIYCLRIEGFIPCRIEPTHTTGKIGAIPILGLNIVRVLRNTIIDSIERFDEFLKSRSTCVLRLARYAQGQGRIPCRVSTKDFRLLGRPE